MKTKFLSRLAGLGALLVLLLTTVTTAFAQATTDAPEMADGLRANGKIYVVVVVVVVIIGGLLAYLISLDRKVSRLEKENKAS